MSYINEIHCADCGKFILAEEPKEPTTEDIIDFYCRFGNKKMTAERFCITVKELNAILKSAKIKKE